MAAGWSARVVAVLVTIVALGVVPATAHAAQTPAGVTITGLDLHDGTIVEVDGVFHFYGTMYGCGFTWGAPSPWCGFGVSRARSLSGPWTAPVRLFSPDEVSPSAQRTWQALCGDTGLGCFNPRMVRRSGWGPDDGAWLLWFNAPADHARERANAYYVLHCAGPTGPCGGSGEAVVKPALHVCTGNGDFSIVPDDPRPPVMLCTMADQTLSSERLTPSGTGGAGDGRHRLAGIVRTEAPGAYRDTRTGSWIMTYNDPNCGYCTGTPTSYAIATAPDGEWTAPGNENPDWGAPPFGRRAISATSCGGQGRTVVTLRGQAYQLIDLWLGTANETGAGIRLEPLIYLGESPPGKPLAAFVPWTCGAGAEGHGQRGAAAPLPL
ncbi:hypothetical protein SAMN05443637_12458 [Pseudonocardia thermophila]|uniref:Glycosyl hydrolases family 43 n=1 Tax=Pseudonocardia thermophila TaxID=1848 RepID=A0A1M6ZM88_PSETH|nr:hypothetical protein [Pseudonocardia thermophila]SHL31601.1 hypothetical protein SAMN05443637_12458 [Pseudonocardia thermophila]